jgi:dienelactone hydrolase
MAEVVVFHHAHGRTAGVVAFADELRRAGHTVYVPDLYEGRTFDDLEAGVGHAQGVGFTSIVERGVRAVDGLPGALVYAGFSLGAMPAQQLAQSRPDARGALLFHACLPTSEFGDGWPACVAVQVHAMEADPFVADGGDIDAARGRVASADQAELVLYPGKEHLFTDVSLVSYDPAAATLVAQRVLDFLAALNCATPPARRRPRAGRRAAPALTCGRGSARCRRTIRPRGWRHPPARRRCRGTP